MGRDDIADITARLKAASDSETESLCALALKHYDCAPSDLCIVTGNTEAGFVVRVMHKDELQKLTGHSIAGGHADG